MPSAPAAASPAAPVPQRLCPHCASVAVTAAPRCPWCGRSYRRRVVASVAGLLVVQAVVILGTLAIALVIAGHTVQTKVDDGIDRVQRDVRHELTTELDQRLPRQTP
jgi:hypothetical protein